MSAESNAYSAAQSFSWWQGNTEMTEVEAQLRDAAAIRDAAEELLAHRVLAARDAGMSWNQLGNLLGLSRQGVAKRYGNSGQLF